MKKMDFDEAIKHLGDISDSVNPKLEKGMKLVCAKIASDIQESMSKTPRDTGKSYFRNNKRIPHHPSMPGNPPAPDTGNLRRSIRFRVENKDYEVNGKVGSTQTNPPYGAYLEYGYVLNGKAVPPRPWLHPAMENNKEFMKETFKTVIQSSLKGK